MSNWKQWIDQPEEKKEHQSKKPNKNIFCRRNKLGNNRYGYHEYAENSKECKYCGHVKKENIQFNNEIMNEGE